MQLADALVVAQDLADAMRPYCESVHVAGSIRRRKPVVGDVEIVAVPRWVDSPDPMDLFGESTRPVNLLHSAWLPGSGVRWIRAGVETVHPCAPRPDGAYWRGQLPCGHQLDLFLAKPDNAGLILLIRTGSAEYSQAVVTHAKRIGKPCKDGYLWDTLGRRIPTPTEESVFAVLGLQWVAPEQRRGWSDLRAIGRAA